MIGIWLFVVACRLGVLGHGVSTRMFECQCWDQHTHSPSPMPRMIRYMLPPAQSHKKKKKSEDNDKSKSSYADSYDY